MRLLAQIGMKLDVLDDAELLLEASCARARLSCRALRLCDGVVCGGTSTRRRSRRSTGCCRSIRSNRTYRSATPRPASDSGNTREAVRAVSRTIGGDSGGHGTAPVGRTRLEDARPTAARRSTPIAPPPMRTGLWRCLLESRESQDLPILRAGNRANARPGGTRRASCARIDTICASRSAKRSRIGPSMPSRLDIMSGATR